MKPNLSVVIPIHSADVQGLAIKGLSRDLQKLPENIELHLVFNPKRPRLPKQLENNTSVHIWVNESKGVNRARNFGANQAAADWVYFLDADCWPKEVHHFEKLVRKIPSLDPERVYGGSYSLTEPSTAVSRAYHSLQEKWLKDGEHPDYGWVHLLGGNLLVSKQIFTKLKFDDGIRFGGAETDFLAKWLARGGKAQYLNDFPVEHLHKLSGEQLRDKAFMQGFGFERLVQRGLLLRKFKKTVRTATQDRRLEYWISEYDRVFDLGRQHFREGLPLGNSRTQRRWQRFKRALVNRLNRNSEFGSEVDRLVRPGTRNS